MNKKTLFSLFLSAGIFFASGMVSVAHAQIFKFQLETPADQIAVGAPVQVNILINTAGQAVMNGDALFTYDPANISVDSATTGNFFTYYSATPLGGSNNKYLVTGWEGVGYDKSSTTDEVFYTINMTLKGSPTTLSFDCTAGTAADSNINRASDTQDIIVCPLAPLTITAGGSTAPSPSAPAGTAVPTPSGGEPVATNTPIPTMTPAPSATPRPTNTPVPTNTPRPTISELPRSGTVEVTMLGMGLGTLFVIAGLLLVAI